ncbi:MAG: adaptor protein MecA [Ruminococcaceae bacterium]|nr:adaptor protein MecA [Oscillospiraceae bacterium]
MTIQAIGKTSYLIVISDEELKKNDLSIEEFSKSDAEKLYRLAMPKPLQENSGVCLEVYPGNGELMIFVRFCHENVVAVAFENFEELLEAVKLCPEMRESELLHDGEQYILVITLREDDEISEGIYEFGERLDINDEHLPWLREHSVRIITGKAIETLLNVF